MQSQVYFLVNVRSLERSNVLIFLLFKTNIYPDRYIFELKKVWFWSYRNILRSNLFSLTEESPFRYETWGHSAESTNAGKAKSIKWRSRNSKLLTQFLFLRFVLGSISSMLHLDLGQWIIDGLGWCSSELISYVRFQKNKNELNLVFVCACFL